MCVIKVDEVHVMGLLSTKSNSSNPPSPLCPLPHTYMRRRGSRTARRQMASGACGSGGASSNPASLEDLDTSDEMIVGGHGSIQILGSHPPPKKVGGWLVSLLCRRVRQAYSVRRFSSSSGMERASVRSRVMEAPPDE